MDDEKIKIELDKNDLNIIYYTIEYSNNLQFKGLPTVDSIANEGLSRPQWLTIKSAIEAVYKFMGVSESGAPIEWNKEKTLKKINAKLS